MVYDLVMTKSREVGNESMSTDEFLGCDNVVTLMLMIVMILNLSFGSKDQAKNETG